MKLYKTKTDNPDWGKITVYQNKDNSISFALYTYNDDTETLYFSSLFVDEQYRNNGYGNKILQWVFNYAKTNSFNAIVLNVVKGSWMQKWYERNGFIYVEDCTQPEYNGNVWMRKDL